ncbi:hypothetical protein H3V53_30535 [Paraburkholderia bengalensis]|uniref:Uncharacterized protein n=1 Tax=Paraburkholderia bengalensis TaxID=2747562 RepID=A0ABU8J159_9BURK
MTARSVMGSGRGEKRPQGLGSVGSTFKALWPTSCETNHVPAGRGGDDVTVFERISVRRPATSQSKNLSYIVTPSIMTTSSSQSLLTWPPTDFSVTLECTITDPSGKLVTKKSVTGSGHAEFSEFKHNFGLAAQRATLDAVQKMQSAMQESAELRP